MTSAVADIKYIILKTPSFKNDVPKIKTNVFNMDFLYSCNDQPTIVSFTTIFEKNFPFFSFIYQRNSKKATSFKPNTLQNVHCPMKNSKKLLLKTENHETFSSEMPQTLFLSKLKR